MPDERSVPSCLGDLTPEWLTFALREGGRLASGAVRSLELLPSDASHGTFSVAARVKVVYDHQESGLPRNMFVKLAPQDESRSRFEVGAREAVFYHEVARSANVRTPKCYYSAVDRDRKRYVILLEDLSAAECGDWATGCSLERAVLAVNRIAVFHAQWWEHPQLAEMDWLRSWNFSGWQQTYVRGLDFLIGEIKDKLPEAAVDACKRIADHVVDIMQQLHYGHPFTMIHMDYQLDNLFFGMGDDDLIVADWQMVSQGRGALDVGNFLHGNIDPVLRKEKENDILRTYHSILVQAGIDYTFEQCIHDYRLSLLPRIVRIVLRLGRQYPGTTQVVRDRLQDVIYPRYYQAFADLKAWELI